MNTYLIFLNTQAMVWDYAPNRQWLEARSLRIASTNETTIHAGIIETDETPQEVREAMSDTLPEQTDDFDVIEIDGLEVADLDYTALSAWLDNRRDWQGWRSRHR